MSLFILDLDRLRQVEASQSLPEYSEVWGDRVRWRVCPECLWLAPSYDPLLRCTRPADVPIHYGGVYGIGLYGCHSSPMQRVPDAISDALFAALRVGGVNAVVAMLATLKPEDVGLISSVEKARERRTRVRQ